MASARSRSPSPLASGTSSQSRSFETETVIYEETANPWWNEDIASATDVQSFVYETESPEDEGPTNRSPILQFEALDYGSWESAPNSNCHASFGDQGTTATVGAFGQLLQFSECLGAGNSGVFSADHLATSEPYFVWGRTRNLQEMSQQPFQYGSADRSNVTRSYGLRFPNLVMRPEAQPQPKWIYWRRPRHEYGLGDFRNYPNLKMTTQWVIRESTVLQQCILENYGEEEIKIDMEFCKTMVIRDLDHVEDDHTFNNEGVRNHCIRPGPKAYSWVCFHKFPDYEPGSELAGLRNPARVSALAAQSEIQGSVAPTRNGILGIESHQVESGQSHPVHEENTFNSRQDSNSGPKVQQTHQSANNAHENGLEPGNPHGVFVISSVAINGKVQLFDDSVDPRKWSLIVKNRGMSDSDGQPQALEVITAYKMSLSKTADIDWKAAVIPLKTMNVNGFLEHQVPLCPLPMSAPAQYSEGPRRQDPPEARDLPLGPFGTPGRSSPHKHLDFVARRNLEHILSVCAIEVMPVVSDPFAANRLPVSLRPHGLKAVALTCGDMSGHRVSWPASFFAFRFLIEAHKNISRLPKQPYVDHILARIKATCLGHLKWLHFIQQQADGQRFGPNYWVTGRLMVSPDSSESWVAGDSYLDTAFQILKAAASVELSVDNAVAADLLSEWAPSWMLSLEKSDHRKKYAWPHAEDDGVNTFRLDDHVWIWRALKSLENGDRNAWNLMSEKASHSRDSLLVDGQALQPGEIQPSTTPEFPDIPPTALSKTDIARLRRTFASELVQREVSQRFTTENDLIGKRMLAVAKSCRETRFLLHARDTALLYNEMADFIGEDTSVQELWRNTMECQEYHDGNQESNWENAIRYALCIMIGIRGLRINSKPPGELVRTATEVLFRSSSPNGFFPGNLQLLTKKPLEDLFSDEKFRDFHYHANFEISYILLTHAKDLNEEYEWLAASKAGAIKSKSTPNAKSEEIVGAQGPGRSQRIQPTQSNVSLSSGDSEQTQLLLNLVDVLSRRSATSRPDNHEVWGDAMRAANRQRLTMKKAVPFNNLIDSSSIVKIGNEWLFKYPEFFMNEKSFEKNTEVAFPSLSERLPDIRWQFDLEFRWRTPFHAIWVVDVPSSKLIKGKSSDHSPSYEFCDRHELLREFLRTPRTARDSKKRLLYFRWASLWAADVCIGATERPEKLNMSDFFERHYRYEKHAIDHCSLLHNSWETEFHLSYYQLLQVRPSIPPLRLGVGPKRLGIPPLRREPFPGDEGKEIVRASASFRFKGDFFDRYWTCHMLEYNQTGWVMSWDPMTCLDDKQHRQRKVLEQHFVASILEQLIESNTLILKEAKRGLGFKSDFLFPPIRSNNAYSSWSDLWQKFEPFLQTLEDDLRSTQVTLDQWDAREEDRGEEKPRWTRNDEKKYRAPITEFRRKIKRQRSELQRLHTEIKSLRETCSNRLVRAREELSFRSGQNIASFTYVTVVFLPLGFTASIFSMNGSPGTSLVISMLVASVIALAVTIVALMNARVLARIAENLSGKFSRRTEDAMGSILMRQDRTELENEQMAHGDSPRRHSEKTISWNLAFWAGYIFIEVPARRIALACRALGWPRGAEHQGGPRLAGPIDDGLLTGPDPAPAASFRVKQFLVGRLTPLVPYLRKIRARIDEYLHRITRVLSGFFLLPIFMAAWICRILLFNVLDMLLLLGELLRKGLSAFLTSVEGSDADLARGLANTSRHLRPMKGLRTRLWPPEKLEPQDNQVQPN